MLFLVERYLLHSLELLHSPSLSMSSHLVVRPQGASYSDLGLQTSEVRELVHLHVDQVSCSGSNTLRLAHSNLTESYISLTLFSDPEIFFSVDWLKYVPCWVVQTERVQQYRQE